jgi:ABC-type amino acid transport substrate-binding protein
MRRKGRCLLSAALLTAVAVAAQACSAIPRDTKGALDRATGGVLHVGVIEHRPWTIVEPQRIGGVEPQLLDRWASQIGARIEWHRGSIEELVEALERRELDVLAAGFYDTTPYAPRLALTQPYLEVEDAHEKKRALVLAVTPGESALLFSLDKFLATLDESDTRSAAAAAGSAQHQP